jgi:hypothetical protein
MRMAPDVELQYKEWTIPKNVSSRWYKYPKLTIHTNDGSVLQTPVGMTIYHMHRDPNVFPEPFKFKPERWLGDIDPRMNRNYVPWAKGSRDCLGKKYLRSPFISCPQTSLSRQPSTLKSCVQGVH